MSRMPAYLAGRCASSYEIERLFNIELLPCPFCSSKSIGVVMGPIPHVMCFDCGGEGPQTPDDRRDELANRQYAAVSKWNVRAQRKPEPR
jgi:hypothetical protein